MEGRSLIILQMALENAKNDQFGSYSAPIEQLAIPEITTNQEIVAAQIEPTPLVALPIEEIPTVSKLRLRRTGKQNYKIENSDSGEAFSASDSDEFLLPSSDTSIASSLSDNENALINVHRRMGKGNKDSPPQEKRGKKKIQSRNP